MLGSALETILILMIDVHSEEAEKTGKVPIHKGTPKPLLKWELVELLRVVKAAGWLPSALNLNDDWKSRKAKVGDYAEVVRMMRNLAHPARYLKDHTCLLLLLGGRTKHLRPVVAPVADGGIGGFHNHLVRVVGMEKVEGRARVPSPRVDAEPAIVILGCRMRARRS